MDKRIIAYLRVSTSAQCVESQKHAIASHLRARGVDLSLVDWVSDEASGATLSRVGMAQVIAEIDRGRVGEVVIYSLDRLARTLVEGIIEIDRWQKRGIVITSVMEGIRIDPADVMGRAIWQIITAVRLAMAESERSRIVEKTRAGLAVAREMQRRAKLLHAQGVPVGVISARLSTGRKKYTTAQVERMIASEGAWWGGRHGPPGESNEHPPPPRERGPRGQGRQITERMSRVLAMRRHGLTHQEIARAVGCSTGTIRWYVYQAKKLREQADGQKPELD